MAAYQGLFDLHADPGAGGLETIDDAITGEKLAETVVDNHLRLGIDSKCDSSFSGGNLIVDNLEEAHWKIGAAQCGNRTEMRGCNVPIIQSMSQPFSCGPGAEKDAQHAAPDVEVGEYAKTAGLMGLVTEKEAQIAVHGAELRDSGKAAACTTLVGSTNVTKDNEGLVIMAQQDVAGSHAAQYGDNLGNESEHLAGGEQDNNIVPTPSQSKNSPFFSNQVMNEGPSQRSGSVSKTGEKVDDSILYNVPITVVDKWGSLLPVLGHNSTGHKVAQPRRKRGRPRKLPAEKVNLKTSNMDPTVHSSLLEKVPEEIANVVWGLGRQLGVSGVDDEDLMVQRLSELETRDRLAIGRRPEER
ncbi:geranylgeranylglyceryl/heptaprenylglyceryl phosphate synthase [Sesbania bispinosa]|nr:geranylgeranylglyceryl/heptaprenylglyceryl phosphate synthase [Sesbania bispinosa]